MRILISSNSPFMTSGYGIQNFYMIKMFIEMGHEVYIICWDIVVNEEYRYVKVTLEAIKELIKKFNFDCTEKIDVYDDIYSKVNYFTNIYDNFPCVIYPKDINKLITQNKIDVFIYLLDAWIIIPEGKFSCKSVCWLPLHFEPMESVTKEVLYLFDHIVLMSKYGRKIYLDEFPKKTKNISIIPHIVDKYTLGIEDDMNKKYTRDSFREELKIPKDAFMVTMIAKNAEESNRKGFDMNIAGFKKFLDQFPNAILYLHTSMLGACNISSIILYNSIPVDKVWIADQDKIIHGYNHNYMNGIYKSTDIFLGATCSEGFGLPLVEAQFMGVPVVGTNCTAMKDYVFNGYLADYIQKRFVYVNESYWYIPDPESIKDCLLKIFNRSEKEKENMKEYGIRNVNKTCKYDVIKRKWNNLLNNLFKQPT